CARTSVPYFCFFDYW
nr:immunoglobulin heavy chain junction region [Mus musculus]